MKEYIPKLAAIKIKNNVAIKPTHILVSVSMFLFSICALLWKESRVFQKQ